MAREKLLKNSLIYTLFTLLQRGLGFFLLPLYTIYLSKDQYGVLSILMAAVPFFVLIAGLSLRGSTSFYYYKHKEEEQYLRKLLGTSFSFLLIFALVLTSFLFLAKDLLIQVFFKDIEFYPYLFLAFLSVFFQPAYFYYQSYLKAKQKASVSAGLDFLYFSVLISLTLVFVIIFKMQSEGVLLSLATANFLMMVITLIKFSKEISYSLDFSILRKVLKYALPILPHNLFSWAMNLADRIILNALTTLEMVAVFDIGSQIGKLVNMITLGVNSAYSPWFFEQVKMNEKSKQRLADTAEKIVFFYVFCAIVVSWLAPEVIFIISKNKYPTSWQVVPLIALAFVVNGFYFCFSNVFFLDKTKILPLLSLFGALVNIGVNYMLIPRYGFIGAGLASLSSKLLFCTLAYYVSQRFYAIPYNIVKISLVFIAGSLLSLLVYLVQPKIEDFNVWVSILGKTSVLFIFVAPLIIINYKRIKQFLNFRKVS
ncbi:oligosaccharide flippase family protein [uncultured Aquimarina sp.]|uniref:lipopolysaccharide biosynthesis protein n=1 Tax=uncultured Aquimarina sp. TaxID=575652 RepID=UPI002628D10A|nr:oligosaccharide flippase family protein [uncultured Aquimarina sp.]